MSGYGENVAARRKLDPAEAFVPDQVEYHAQELTGKRAFFCKPLRANSMTVDACCAQFNRRLASCIGCKVGQSHSGRAEPGAMDRNEFGIVNVQPESCVRCGRDGKDPHSERMIARFRTVQRASNFLAGGSRRTTCCVSCFNRARECRADVMSNSKGALPKKAAAFLRDAVISYAWDGKTFDGVDVGQRSSVMEVRRLLERAYDGKANLIEVRFNGEIADLKSTDDPPWIVDTLKPAPAPRYARKVKTVKPVPQESSRKAVRNETIKHAEPMVRAQKVSPTEGTIGGESMFAYGFASSTADDRADLVKFLVQGWPSDIRAPRPPVQLPEFPVITAAEQPVTEVDPIDRMDSDHDGALIEPMTPSPSVAAPTASAEVEQPVSEVVDAQSGTILHLGDARQNECNPGSARQVPSLPAQPGSAHPAN